MQQPSCPESSAADERKVLAGYRGGYGITGGGYGRGAIAWMGRSRVLSGSRPAEQDSPKEDEPND